MTYDDGAYVEIQLVGTTLTDFGSEWDKLPVHPFTKWYDTVETHKRGRKIADRATQELVDWVDDLGIEHTDWFKTSRSMGHTGWDTQQTFHVKYDDMDFAHAVLGTWLTDALYHSWGFYIESWMEEVAYNDDGFPINIPVTHFNTVDRSAVDSPVVNDVRQTANLKDHLSLVYNGPGTFVNLEFDTDMDDYTWVVVGGAGVPGTSFDPVNESGALVNNNEANVLTNPMINVPYVSTPGKYSVRWSRFPGHGVLLILEGQFEVVW